MKTATATRGRVASLTASRDALRVTVSRQLADLTEARRLLAGLLSMVDDRPEDMYDHDGTATEELNSLAHQSRAFLARTEREGN